MGMADIILKDTKIIEIDIDKIVDAVLAAMPESDFELSKEERKNYNRFIRIMSEIEWPAYMDGDIDFHETIINLYENGTIEDVIVAVHEHYNSDYIDDLHKRLEESDVINKKRVPIIKEVLELYKLGYYYGTVTTLLSQIIGLVKDIEVFCNKNRIQFNPENEKILFNRYKVSKNSEKKRIIATLLEGKDRNDEEREYLYLIGYFRSIIFSDKLDESRLDTDVSRNMVFHGEQLTFGSKDQALKLIICIDSLWWVSELLSLDV